MKQLFKTIEKESDNIYSPSTRPPQYTIRGTQPKLEELINPTKYIQLMAKINKSSVSDEEKEFLKKAATRHLQFQYSNIAEYYANASKEMQELMEESALVIIDFDNAIANGYVKLSTTLEKIIQEERKLKELNEK